MRRRRRQLQVTLPICGAVSASISSRSLSSCFFSILFCVYSPSFFSPPVFSCFGGQTVGRRESEHSPPPCSRLFAMAFVFAVASSSRSGLYLAACFLLLLLSSICAFFFTLLSRGVGDSFSVFQHSPFVCSAVWL